MIQSGDERKLTKGKISLLVTLTLGMFIALLMAATWLRKGDGNLNNRQAAQA